MSKNKEISPDLVEDCAEAAMHALRRYEPLYYRDSGRQFDVLSLGLREALKDVAREVIAKALGPVQDENEQLKKLAADLIAENAGLKNRIDRLEAEGS